MMQNLLIFNQAFIPFFMNPCLTLGVFVFLAQRDNDILDSSRMFTSLALMTLLSQPLISLFQMLPSIASAIGCLRRIEEYLIKSPHTDSRLVSLETTRSPEPRNGIAEHSETASSSTAVTASPSDIGAITVRGTFGWVQDKDVLYDIDCTFKQSELTIVVGPVASGKSSLCKAILGEVLFAKGSVNLNGVSTEIGFCDRK